MTKNQLSERDIITKRVLPALKKAGWDIETQIREEYSFTAGRIEVRGKVVKRGTPKRVDILLYHKNHYPIALIEAKDGAHNVGDGMQQGLGYAEALDVPFAYSTNGDAFLEHDRLATSGILEQDLPLASFPSPEELYRRWSTAKGIDDTKVQEVISQEYFEVQGRKPRYFQEVAVNRVVEEIAKGKKRLLLVMATGTGKTYTAFQIIWRLWKAKKAKRVLFLVDRNILADQAIINDFKHFGSAMTKIEGHNVDKAYEVYLALYQGLTGSEEDRNIFKQFSPDFFDLIVVDECHRGGIKQNSPWREVLEYYSSATQIGLTATPKETTDVSTQAYFGEPVYTYSLRQGIDDGFLAPYKVIRMVLDRDVEGYRPESGQLDEFGNEIPDKVYKGSDMETSIVLEERAKLVAKKISDFLKATGRMQKTIVFCQDIEHAERMRQALVNENIDLMQENSRYVTRITGDNPEGKALLDHFIDPENPYPVIAVTSKLMTTGVDAQTCKFIVLDANINSMTEFKQIIGRGTRVREDLGKMYFTIMDFRGVTELFADPTFDGDPVVVYRAGQDDPVIPPEEVEDGGGWTIRDGEEDTGASLTSDTWDPTVVGGSDAPRKYYVQDVPVTVLNERVQYLGTDGKLITESLTDYTKRNILSEFASLDAFLSAWSTAERKEKIIAELEDRGVFLDALADEVGRDLDPFDLICHVAFGREPLTRQARAKKAKQASYFDEYEGTAREIINVLIDKYADQGITAIDDIGDLVVSPFDTFGTPLQIVDLFGGRDGYLAAVKKIEAALYSEVTA